MSERAAHVDDRAAWQAGDRLRRYLTLVSLAGLMGAYLLRNEISTWLAASVLFGIAVMSCLASLFSVKARELARASAQRAGSPPPEYAKWDLRSSWTWDSLAFALIGAGGCLVVAGVVIR
jgi:hypothetical protein